MKIDSSFYIPVLVYFEPDNIWREPVCSIDHRFNELFGDVPSDIIYNDIISGEVISGEVQVTCTPLSKFKFDPLFNRLNLSTSQWVLYSHIVIVDHDMYLVRFVDGNAYSPDVRGADSIVPLDELLFAGRNKNNFCV